MIARVMSAVLLTTISVAGVSMLAQQADSPKEVMAALADGVKLLETKKYLDFAKTYVRPNELEEQVKQFGTIEGFAAELAKNSRTADLLKRMQAAQKLKPAFTNEGTRATFTFDAPVAGGSRVVMQKIGDRWYFRD